MTHVLIATPTAGGVVKAFYATTLVKTIIAVKEAGWGVDFITVDGSYISKSRNYFAHLLLRQPHFTHLVMIDSDMAVEGMSSVAWSAAASQLRPLLTRSVA